MARPNEPDFRSEAERHIDLINWAAHEGRMQGNSRVRAAKRIIAADPGDLETVREVASQTMGLITRSPAFRRAMRYREPFLPCPPGLVSGPICLGRTQDRISGCWQTVGLHPHEIQQNILICGRAGAGKTTLIYNILGSLTQNEIPFWAIDFKRDYRHLVKSMPNILVFMRNKFKWNPLQPPPGVPPVQWLQTFTDVFCEVFFPTTASASKNLILSTLDFLYREYGVYEGVQRFPTLEQFNDELESMLADPKSARQDARTINTCLNKVRPMVQLMSEMFCGESEIALEDLLDRSVVFEFDGLTTEYQAFLITMLLHWVFAYRIANGQRGPLRHVLVFDEAKMVYAQDRVKPSSHMTRLTSMMREFGEGLIVADQMPSSLGEAIKANVYTTIVLNLSSMRDIQSMVYGLGLDGKQRQCLLELLIGRGIVRLAGRYPRPFLLQISDAASQKDVVDEQIEQHMRKVYYTQTLANAADIFHPTDAPTDDISNPMKPERRRLLTVADEKSLSPIESMLLASIRDRPYLSTTDRYRTLGLGAKQATSAIARLLEKEYLTAFDLPVSSGAGRPGRFFELTHRAVRAVGAQRLGPGKGGFAHRFFQHRVHQHYQSLGYRAQIEACLAGSGKCVDVGVWKPGYKSAIEIAMNPHHEPINLVKDIEAGWNEVVITYLDSKVAKKIQQFLREEHQVYLGDGKVKLISVRQILD